MKILNTLADMARGPWQRRATARYALRLPLGLLAVAMLAPIGATRAHAEPSGGPYGPIQQRYEMPAAKRVFVVAPDGKGGAPATIEAPTTLESAIAEASSGDAIVLRGGVYRTGNLQLNQGITIQPYGEERPIIKGTELLSNWTAQENGLWRANWTKLFPAKPADWWRRSRHARETPLVRFNNDMVFLDGELLSAVGSEHEVDAHSYFIDYEAGTVYLGTDPSKRQVEITAHDSALVRTTKDVHGKKSDGKGPTIRGIVFTQYAYRALEVEGTEPDRLADPSTFGKEVVGTTLEHVTISFCSRVAGYFRGDKFVVRNCLIADNGTEGIYVIDSADILLERNIITRTNVEKITGYYASAVKIFNQSYRAVVRDNLIIDNPEASGVWWDVGNVDAVFVSNWVETTNDGFFFEISKGATCAGNVFVNCNKGVRVLNSSNVRLYQNTFVNSAAWIERTERSAVGDHFGWHPSTGPDVAERHGHVFTNNLLFADETFPGALLHLEQSAAVRDRLKDPQVKELDSNVFVRRSGATERPLIAWSPAANPQSRLILESPEALHRAYPQFAEHSRYFRDYHGPLFKGAELHRFELVSEFAGATLASRLPADIQALLGGDDRATAPGAYRVPQAR